ncbi:hypothetical protein MPER_12632 [Moniliophthora perniciosa FA553]|nr:hypothetical protein MPER_12632 [Moniliophthora perniciosa FA553]
MPMRWNKFKWTIFATNTVLAVWSITDIVLCLITWFNVWTMADIIRVGNRSELILSTLAASLGVITSLIGYAGILMSNRTSLLYTPT